MSPVLLAVLIVTGIGLVCAGVLAVASHFMSVPVNELEVKVRECLPGANCGACGFTGCDGYAKALAETSGTKTNLCVPGADAVAKKIADVMGVEAEDVVEQVAFVRCSGDCINRKEKHVYKGIESCLAAQMLYGGSGACTQGCLGLGDCQRICPQNAICIENGIALFTGKRVAQDRQRLGVAALSRELNRRNARDVVGAGPAERKRQPPKLPFLLTRRAPVLSE